MVAAARAALNLATPELRNRLWSNIRAFSSATGVKARSPIVPLVIGSERSALEASALLLQHGLLVPAIRPPTVPEGTARLRIALSASHKEEEIAALAHAIRASGTVPLEGGV